MTTTHPKIGAHSTSEILYILKYISDNSIMHYMPKKWEVASANYQIHSCWR